MGTTDVQGWPYPDPGDLIKDGAADLRALAGAIDTFSDPGPLTGEIHVAVNNSPVLLPNQTWTSILTTTFTPPAGWGDYNLTVLVDVTAYFQSSKADWASRVSLGHALDDSSVFLNGTQPSRHALGALSTFVRNGEDAGAGLECRKHHLSNSPGDDRVTQARMVFIAQRTS